VKKVLKEKKCWSAKIKKAALATLLFVLFAASVKLGGFAGLFIGFVFFYLFFQLISR